MTAWPREPGSAACQRCHSPSAPEDLRCPVCLLPRPVDVAGTDSVVARILRCDGCGAALSYDVEARAPKCAFCGSVAHVEETVDPVERADAYLPFRVAPEQARAALRSWLGTLGYFRPPSLASEATVESLTPLWWVGWTLDVDALVSWAADTDAGAGRAAWAPHAGQGSITLRSLLVSASRGLTDEETAKLASAFDLGSAQAAPHDMPGAAIERFDVQRSAARRVIAGTLRAEAKRAASSWMPGGRQRNVAVEVMPKALTTRRYAFPTYVMAYRYREEVYRAVVHGQDAARTFGRAPYSWFRIAAAIAVTLFGLAFFLTVAIVLLSLLAG